LWFFTPGLLTSSAESGTSIWLDKQPGSCKEFAISPDMEERTSHNILLVEDTLDDALLMKRALHQSGLGKQVQLARDGKEAVEYLTGAGTFSDRKAFPLPHLILLDLQLPHMHGLKVLEWIRSQAQFRSTIVVVLSSSRQTGDIELAYRLGCNSYLVKPPTLDALHQTVGAIALYWLTLNQWPQAS
jgi:CheY-like chemotaxis protein